MKNFKVFLLSATLLTSGSSLFLNNSYADATASAEKSQMQQNKKQAERLREVSGTIIKKKTVKLPEQQGENVVVMLKTSKGDERLILDLGSQKSLEEHNISKDKKIKAQGRMVQLGTQQFMVASKIKIDDKIVDIDRKHQKAGKAPASEQQKKQQAE